jgi:hypothetical protein
MLAGLGEDVSREGASVRMNGWRLGAGIAPAESAFLAWSELWAGACAAHDRFLRLDSSSDAGAARWRFAVSCSA